MNLIFDIGENTHRFAVYDKDKKIGSVRSRAFNCEKLLQTVNQQKIDKGIICSMKELPEFIYDLMSFNIPEVHILTHKTRLPFKNEYKTPEMIGPDRIAAVAGAYYLFPGRNILVINAGKVITYDYLSGKIWKGRNISPGLSIRFKALHNFTKRLPLGTTLEKYDSPGKNTLEALSAGVVGGLIYEMNGYIRSFQEKNIDSMIILTGGDSGYIKSRISKNINYQPDLVLDGLNHILEYNAKKP